MLVTGRTVAASERTAKRLIDHCRDADPELDLTTEPSSQDGPDGQGESALVCVVGARGWSSRRWVALVTRFFEEGGRVR